MNILLTIIAFVVIFSILILVHELGHFTMAKRAGIKVEEFGFGLPPRIWGKKKGETVYSINWIPFGGFVRMLGEDSRDISMAKDKRSFAAQSKWVRMKVLSAGVVMNFLLAWLLLTVGFTVGMEPLLLPEDILPAVRDNVLVLEEGAKVKIVPEESVAADVGIQPEDRLVAINGQPVDFFAIEETIGSAGPVTYSFIRGTDKYSEVTLYKPLDAEFYSFTHFPRLQIMELTEDSDLYVAGLRVGDVLMAIDGRTVLDGVDYEKALSSAGEMMTYRVYRNSLWRDIVVEGAGGTGVLEEQGKEPDAFTEREKEPGVFVAKVLKEMPAAESGLQVGDVILAINGKQVFQAEEIGTLIAENSDVNLAIQVQRGEDQLLYEVAPKDQQIGVLLSNIYRPVDEGVTFYQTEILASVTEIKDEKYPFFTAAYKSFGEMWRLSRVTALMLTSTVGDLVSSGEVPETVAGPVGIAQMTHVFVQEGFVALMRFMALLSLSLAVINILPFPALDGGRLLFIVFELVSGRKVNQRWEALIHMVGYGLILIFIIAVTYNDILRLIGLN